MEEFLLAQDDAGHFHRTGSLLRRHQEPPPPEEEEDPVDLALAPYRDPHYADRSRDRLRFSHHHYYRPPRISSQQPRPRPRSPSPSPSPSPHASATTAAAPSSKRACTPASNKAILGLKEAVLSTTMDQDDCAICLKALADRPPDQEGEEDTAAADAQMTTAALRAMPCSHIFHQHCIFQWLRRNAVCPLCRHQLPTTDGGGGDDDDDDNNPNNGEGRRLSGWLQQYLEAEAEGRRRLLLLRRNLGRSRIPINTSNAML